ncbi:NADPH-dependent diflavin oxidoreductase 1 isoform X2 [Leptidea sinapis]|uniref:NADPH-dependent diflavin oxidoreductase 1 isoform X2 n=1 Tax=Leptidea sinapis TaxID=189913 RepID=UPI0021223710|nr:NADPH-dependent diflavin oxidoreductase 1 isoform X2 [Leptidea sinapis]
MENNVRLLVLFGSQTYTAQEIAERIWRDTKVLGFKGPVLAMDDYPISNLIYEKLVLFVCSTTGDGDEPDNMKTFWKFLLRKNLPSNSLINLKYAVVGLGDSSYAKFNFAAKKLQKRLSQLGGTPLHETALCDYQHDLGHNGVLSSWLKNFYTKLKLCSTNVTPEITETKFVPRWKVSLNKRGIDDVDDFNEDIYFSNGNTAHFVNPLHLEIEKNKRITDESHFQDVRLITFKTINDKLKFDPGDTLNIRPRNSTADIKDLFDIFETHNLDIKAHYILNFEECHEDMPVPNFLKQPLSVYMIAEQYWDLKAYPTQYVFALLALVSEDKLEREKCIELSSPEGQEEWLNYCRRPRRTILEVKN